MKRKAAVPRVRKGKSAKTLPATVEKIIPPGYPGDSERAEVAVHGAEDLYRELRVENRFSNDSGEEVALKPGAQVEVTIEANKKDTHRKSSGRSNSV